MIASPDFSHRPRRVGVRGLRSPDPIARWFRNYDAGNRHTVITEGEELVTVIPGRLR